MTSCDGCANECAGSFSCESAATTYGGNGGFGCEKCDTVADYTECNGGACASLCFATGCFSSCGQTARCSACSGTCVNSCGGCGNSCANSSCSADARKKLLWTYIQSNNCLFYTHLLLVT